MAQLTLHTERLRLVPLADEHLQFEIELDSDAEVMRYITGRASSPDEVEQATGAGWPLPLRCLAWDSGPASRTTDSSAGGFCSRRTDRITEGRWRGRSRLPVAASAVAEWIRQRGRKGVGPLRLRRCLSQSDLRPDHGSLRCVTGHDGRCRADLHPGVVPVSRTTTWSQAPSKAKSSRDHQNGVAVSLGVRRVQTTDVKSARSAPRRSVSANVPTV